jgi:hypothetical protein
VDKLIVERFGAKISSAFGVQDPIHPSARIEHIFGLIAIEEGSRCELLGAILLSICGNVAEDAVDVFLLVEQFHLGWRFTSGEKLYGVEKITGREISKVIQSLDEEQRNLIARWIELATEILVEANCFADEDQVKFEDVQKWVLSC